MKITNNRKRINEIDAEIKKLNSEKSKLLKINLKDTSIPILKRIESLGEMSWKIQDFIQEPFFNFMDDFAKQIGKPKNSLIVDDYTILRMDISRHENITIYDIADYMSSDLKDNKTPEDEPGQLVSILYDRSSKQDYTITLMDALLHLEKWSLKNKIFEWKCDW